jgi:hypothetical protein
MKNGFCFLCRLYAFHSPLAASNHVEEGTVYDNFRLSVADGIVAGKGGFINILQVEMFM